MVVSAILGVKTFFTVFQEDDFLQIYADFSVGDAFWGFEPRSFASKGKLPEGVSIETKHVFLLSQLKEKSPVLFSFFQ